MNHGEFSGDPRTYWMTEAGSDRHMRLLEEFWFRDPDGRVWTTPADYWIDGASIPRALWTLVGSPYTGDYRRASVVHDKACDEAVGDPTARRAADRMFYHACRAGGCAVIEATLLYIGVRIGALTLRVPAWQEASTTDGPRTQPVIGRRSARGGLPTRRRGFSRAPRPTTRARSSEGRMRPLPWCPASTCMGCELERTSREGPPG